MRRGAIFALLLVTVVTGYLNPSDCYDPSNLEAEEALCGDLGTPLSAITFHGDEGRGGHKWVGFVRRESTDGSGIEEERHCYNMDYANPLRRTERSKEEFCRLGCMPFLAISQRLHELQEDIQTRIEAIIIHLPYKREIRKLYLGSLTETVETMARHAFKGQIYPTDFSNPDTTLNKAREYAWSRIIFPERTSLLSSIGPRLGGRVESSDRWFASAESFSKLLEDIENARLDAEYSIESAERQQREGIPLGYLEFSAVHKVPVGEVLLQLTDAFAVPLATSPEPNLQALKCAPMLWFRVGFYQGLKGESDLYTDSVRREGTHYYSHPMCGRLAVYTLMEWQKAVWSKPSESPFCAVSMNKYLRNTVSPSETAHFSCQAFTNGFKSVMKSPSRFFPFETRCKNIRMIKQSMKDQITREALAKAAKESAEIHNILQAERRVQANREALRLANHH